MRNCESPWYHRASRLSCPWLAIFCLATSPAFATLPEADNWALLETESFTLISNLDEAGMRAIGAGLEELHAVVEQQLPGGALEMPVPTLLYAFRDRESFEPFALPGGGSGYVSPHIHANFAALAASDASQATPIVYRQYVSEVMHTAIPQSPLWLSRGLAELLSTFALEGKVARIGASSEQTATLSESQPMSLSELLSLEEYPASAERAGAFVARSWGLVHYLLVGDAERRQKTRQWISRLREDESVRGAFLESYGADAATLERELDAYLDRDQLPERRVTLEGTVASGASFVRLAPADALLALADLLLHTQPAKQAEARELLDAILELDPESAPGTAGMGFLEQQAGDFEAARDLYARALGRFPEQRIGEYRDGFRLYFYYGDAELELLGKKRPQNDDERARLGRAIEAFTRCTELRPAYGEAWARMGYALNLEEKPAPEAVAALERAYGLLPGREDVAMNLLLAYARANEREQASRLVENLVHRGESDETLARAREILFQIDFNAAVGLIRE